MDIAIHGCLDGSVPQKLLKNLGRHTPFDGSGRVGMPLRYNYDKPGKP